MGPGMRSGAPACYPDSGEDFELSIFRSRKQHILGMGQRENTPFFFSSYLRGNCQLPDLLVPFKPNTGSETSLLSDPASVNVNTAQVE